VRMDVQMPRINGFQATQQIRQIPGCETLPIIAMTAHALKGDEEKCLEAGMDGYVSKPINQDRLFYTIWRHLLNKKRVANVNSQDSLTTEKVENSADTFDPMNPAAPVQIPGIDVSFVLQSTGLKWQTFQDILRGFCRDNRNTVAALQQALDAKDRQTLQHLAHSLKGSAGNIGAGELREAADELERGCTVHLPAADVAELCQCLQQELTRLLAVIEPMQKAPEHVRDEGLPRATIDEITLLLTSLAEAIDHADPEAIQKIMTKVMEQLTDEKRIDQVALAALATETQRYDYDQATKTIGDIQKALKEKK
jgi:two-component system, sensor histidine kinase and response regulator